MQIVSVGTAAPPHRYGQDALIAAIKAYWGQHHHNTDRVERFHKSVLVGGRNLALPMEDYEGLSYGAANQAFVRVGTDVGAEAVRQALAKAGLVPADVDAVYFTTVTGIAVPTIDARLCNRLGFRSDVKRVPLFGLGCVAGAAGVARLYDYLRAWPDQVAVLLSVELCSLTVQRSDWSVPNFIASGLFGDGAAAVVAVGAQRAARMGLDPHTAGPRVMASRSAFYPDTERVMGWDVTDTGFKIVLSADVPKMVDSHLKGDVQGFLADHGLSRETVGSWVCHPGGPRVLWAFEKSLGLSQHDLALTWASLREVGNLSSASVLHVLADTMATRRPAPETAGLMVAMGPGFCSEMVLLQW